MKLAKIAAWDQRFFIRVFQRFANQQVFRASYWLSKTADGPLYLLVVAALYGWQPAGYLFFIQVLALGFAIELPLYLLLKNVVKRLRPADLLPHHIQSYITPSDKFSLPSGHTAGAFVFATTIAFNAPHYLPLVLPWALGVGLSRVLLGVHFPCDILAGMLLGVTSVCCAMFLLV